MAGRPTVELWNDWAIQILVLQSFTLQVLLNFFAGLRRREAHPVLMLLLWLAYLLADSTAIYALGHLSFGGSMSRPQQQELVAFWAPFLLVHLGGPDTITAYALEDNQLWLRHLLTLGVQAVGVAYVLYKHTADSANLVLAATLMFVVGVVKYGERTWALKCGSLERIRSSVLKKRRHPGGYRALPQPRGPREERNEEELLSLAHTLLPICKGAMVDRPVCVSKDSDRFNHAMFFEEWNWKYMCEVVEMELSLLYDILYTKAAVIHNWYGYCIRVVAAVAIVLAFLLFKSSDKDGYTRADVAVTYVLLVGAFILEIVSVLRAVVSTWTCDFLYDSGWYRFPGCIQCLRWVFKAGRSRQWSGSIGQYSLLHFCSGGKPSTRLMSNKMGLNNWWDKQQSSGSTLVLSKEVRELLFQRIRHSLESAYSTPSPDIARAEETTAVVVFSPEGYKSTVHRRVGLHRTLRFGAEFQEDILIWHIATDIILLDISTQNAASPTTRVKAKAVKAVSEYMMFLIAVRGYMLPSLGLQSLFEATRDNLEVTWKAENHRGDRTQNPGERLATILRERAVTGEILSAVLADGARYAVALLRRLRDVDWQAIVQAVRLPATSEGRLLHWIPNLSDWTYIMTLDDLLDFILDVWVRILIYSSTRCSPDSHAKQLSRGGDLTTVVWMLAEHAGMFSSYTDGRYDNI